MKAKSLIKTFKRYEIKYLVSPRQFEIIKAELERHMVLDEFCQGGSSYMIYNLYFDTENDDVIRHSLDKPYYKEKLRLRSYSMLESDGDLVFLELKKKIGGIVAKRRANMTYIEAMEFLACKKVPGTGNYQDKQVIQEIISFLERYPSNPKLYISYERLAFFDKNDAEFRISFDKNILTRRTQVNLLDGDFGSELLDDDRYLMEVKCVGRIPLWLCQVLSEAQVYKTSFSKYGTEYKQYAQQKPSYNFTSINHVKSVLAIEYPQLIITA